MALIDQSSCMAAPVEAAWDYVHDASRLAEWDVRIARCEPFTEGPVAEGTPTRYRLRWLSTLLSPLGARYSAYVPHQRAAIMFEGLPWWQLIEAAVGASHFTSIPDGTLFRSTFRDRLKLGRRGAWLDPILFRRCVARDTQRSLNSLRRILAER